MQLDWAISWVSDYGPSSCQSNDDYEESLYQMNVSNWHADKLIQRLYSQAQLLHISEIVDMTANLSKAPMYSHTALSWIQFRYCGYKLLKPRGKSRGTFPGGTETCRWWRRASTKYDFSSTLPLYRNLVNIQTEVTYLEVESWRVPSVKISARPAYYLYSWSSRINYIKGFSEKRGRPCSF